MGKRWIKAVAALVSGVVLAACGTPVSSSLSQSAPSPPSSSLSVSQAAASSLSAPAVSSPAGQSIPPGVTNPLTALPLPEGMDPAARAVAVMVDNNIRGVPQRGLAAADVLVEMPVEDGTTRLLAIYPGYAAVPQVGPVCDLQDQFLQFALPLLAIPAYTDATQYARNLLAAANAAAVDGMALGEISFWFDEGRTLPKPGGYLNEFCWYTDGNLLYQGLAALGIAGTGSPAALFSFAARPEIPAQTAVQAVAVYSDYSSASLHYNAEDGKYLLVNSTAQTDEDGTPKTYQNVLLLRCNIGKKADSQLLEYDFSAGDGYYFTAGGVRPITWKKGDAAARLAVYDETGNPLQVQPGKSYIGFVPSGRENAISWYSAEQLTAQAAPAA